MRIIGRSELVDIVDYDVKQVPAKIDTGAYSSSIDHSLAQVIKRNGQDFLEFKLFHPDSVNFTGKIYATTDFERTEVKNSNGVENRFVIFPEIIVNGEARRCRLTLANRSHLRYPILIGRRFLREAGYVVDVNLGQGLPGDEEERNL